MSSLVVHAPYDYVSAHDMAMIADLEARTFQWFWDSANPVTGLVPDRYPSDQKQASIASVGFALTMFNKTFWILPFPYKLVT